MENVIDGFSLIVGVLVLAVLLSFVLSIPVWVLWNAVVPVVFGFKVVTLFQAWQLSLLSSLLFKGTSTSSGKK
jgi:hypothetical protein